MGKYDLDQLESRRLLSAVVFTPLLPPVLSIGTKNIPADKVEVAYATAKLTSDQQNQAAQIAADSDALAEIRATIVRGSAQRKQFLADEAAAPLTIAADQAAVKAAATTGLPAITADIKAGATAELATDRAAYAAAVSAADTKLQADQASTVQTIANDKAAIKAMLHATPSFMAALSKLQADMAADSATVQVDLEISNAAKGQLAIDSSGYQGLYILPGGPSNGILNISVTAFPIGTTSSISINVSADTVADQTEITSIQAKLTVDQKTQSTDKSADPAAVEAARAAIVNGSSQQAQLKADNAAQLTIVNNDGIATGAVARADVGAVISDYQQIAADQGNPLIMVQELDQDRLAVDQAALHNAVTAAVAKSISDKAASVMAIANDKVAIKALLRAAPSFTSAVAKQQSDAVIDANNVQTDQAILNAANAKLKVDQAAAPLLRGNGLALSTTRGVQAISGEAMLNIQIASITTGGAYAVSSER